MTALLPLREVHDMGLLAKADPDRTPDYVCGLITATTDAAKAAMKRRRNGGWLFGQENFILAVRAIRALNQRHTIYTYGTDLEMRLPTAWAQMADAVEAYSRDIRPPTGWRAGTTRTPREILRVITDGWDKPVRADALESLFDFCISRAMAAFPADCDKVETSYRTGVFNNDLNTAQTLSRLEAGQGETHRVLLAGAANAEASHKEVVAKLDALQEQFAAFGGKFDALQGTADNTQAGVSFLVHDRMGKQAANSKRGKESHEKAVRDDAERKRAKHEMKTALKRVAEDPDVKAGKHGAIIAACRRVCGQFAPLTGAKKNGTIYLQLTKADGEPPKPETLARYHRKRRGGTLGKE